MTSARSLQSIFDSWCKENQGNDPDSIKTYGFRLRVVCSIDIPPRHSTFSWIRGMGVTKFDEIFSGELSRLPSSWMLAFPERHISINEQQKLIHQMVKLNNEKKLGLKELDILTSCPMILSDTKTDCLSLIKFPEGKETFDQDYMM